MSCNLNYFWFSPNNLSAINTTAATISNKWMRLPPILNKNPISHMKTTIPPSNLKNFTINHLVSLYYSTCNKKCKVTSVLI